MFNNNRYVTRGVNSEVDIRLQIIMWELIDKLNKSKDVEVDYLQVFNIYKKQDKILLEHKQEVPEYQKLYEINNMGDVKLEEKLKLFVIDDIDHSTMLLAQEYQEVRKMIGNSQIINKFFTNELSKITEKYNKLDSDKINKIEV